jgi:heat shock protein HtpX
MSSAAVNIPQRRSLAAFALLALGMILSSYLFTFVLAAACVYLPWLAIAAAPNFQTFMLFLGGIAVAGIMLWSLIPRRDKFVAPGPVLQPAAHPRLFAEIEYIAKSLN